MPGVSDGSGFRSFSCTVLSPVWATPLRFSGRSESCCMIACCPGEHRRHRHHTSWARGGSTRTTTYLRRDRAFKDVVVSHDTGRLRSAEPRMFCHIERVDPSSSLLKLGSTFYCIYHTVRHLIEAPLPPNLHRTPSCKRHLFHVRTVRHGNSRRSVLFHSHRRSSFFLNQPLHDERLTPCGENATQDL